ncbi:Rds1 protein [Panus rudis PR-1116 ss-1]|nr:Rds1 protein [Panus rudis PR-1116 ss-1]
MRAATLSILSLSVAAFAVPVTPDCDTPGHGPAHPDGGVGLNGTAEYAASSDYDFQTLNLGVQQELLEMYLFHQGLANFTAEQFAADGLSAEDVHLIEHMANQEVGHLRLLSDIVGPARTAKPCKYIFPYNTIQEWINLSRIFTAVGESGVFGFLQHLDSRASSQLVGQAIATESRQQQIFRQYQGLFPQPFYFVPAITQSMAWTLQSQYLASCPKSNPRVKWQIFPTLNVTNTPNPNVLPDGSIPRPALSTNRTTVSAEGREIRLVWDNPGKKTGPDAAYVTSTNAGKPKFVAWISQLNTTYTPLTNISGNTGITLQPGGTIYGNNTFPTNNGTVYLLLTDHDLFVTPFNLSQIEPHVVAGPAIYTID